MPSEEELQNSRCADKNSLNISELKDLIGDVQIILNRVASKSDQLIGNSTTNLAESWMSIRSKFDGGKVINRCARGSWYTRCYGGALRKNIGVAWSPLTFQNVTRMQAGTNFHLYARRQMQKTCASQKYKRKPESKVLRRKRKLQDLKQGASKKANFHYGSNLDDTPDVSPETLDRLCKEYLQKHVKKNEEQI